jgi:hypothetical protein
MGHVWRRPPPTSRAHGPPSPAPDPDAPPRRTRGRVNLMAELGSKRPTDPLLEIYLERRANLVRFFAARSGSLAVAEDLAQEL